MARYNRVPPAVQVIDLSSDEEDYSREWIQRSDPRFAGRITRAGRLPFGPGFNKDITESQAGGDQCLAIPARFVARWLDRKYSKCILVYKAVKLYEIKLIWHYDNPNQCYFGLGWYDFVLNNRLRAGDNVTVMPTVFEDVFVISVSRGVNRV